MTNNKQVALIVLDGWGYREDPTNNAIATAHKPFFDYLWNNYPHTLLEASGEAVGLPKGQMGNSEIGHFTIGAGRVVDENLNRISKALLTPEFLDNESFKELFNHIKKYDSVLHVAGLVSDGGVHSHIKHLFAFLELAKKNGIRKIAVHVITDGRDTLPHSGVSYIRELENFLEKLGVGEIASIAGRLYTMDRDKRWERLDKSLNVMFWGRGNTCDIKPSEFLSNLYKSGLKSDEYLEPYICLNNNREVFKLNTNDGIFLFNFRSDRMRMITQKILEIKDKYNLFLLTMMKYAREYDCPVVFKPIKINQTLGRVISDNNMTQVHIAETEKFAHATYFLNCAEEKPYSNEDQILIQSPKDVLTYDLAPKMSAEKVADQALEYINKGTNFIFINFANPDMVGHTANVPALIIAIEEVDKQLKRIVESVLNRGGIVCITADHGNAELNIDPKTGEKHTEHTTDLVPFILTDKNITLRDGGGLSNIAATILKLYGFKKPEEMTGESLI